MNCELCQRLLGQTEAPDNPPPELAAHLAECLACRQWQQRLLQIEHNVRQLLVPAAGPQAFLAQKLFLMEQATPAPAPKPSPAAPTPPKVLALPRRWTPSRWVLTLAGSAAAAAVLIACGIFLGNLLSDALRPDGGEQAKGTEKKPPAAEKKDPAKDGHPKPVEPRKGPNPLVAKLLESDLSLAEAETPRHQVETLARLAAALHAESGPLAKASAARELDTLARLYGKVIRDGVVPRAKALPMDERRDALGAIARSLAQASKDAEALAGKANPAAAAPLRQLAAAARDGDTQLRALMEGDAE